MAPSIAPDWAATQALVRDSHAKRYPWSKRPATGRFKTSANEGQKRPPQCESWGDADLGPIRQTPADAVAVGLPGEPRRHLQTQLRRSLPRCVRRPSDAVVRLQGARQHLRERNPRDREGGVPRAAGLSISEHAYPPTGPATRRLTVLQQIDGRVQCLRAVCVLV
jgi:hypothetical protein